MKKEDLVPKDKPISKPFSGLAAKMAARIVKDCKISKGVVEDDIYSKVSLEESSRLKPSDK